MPGETGVKREKSANKRAEEPGRKQSKDKSEKSPPIRIESADFFVYDGHAVSLW